VALGRPRPSSRSKQFITQTPKLTPVVVHSDNDEIVKPKVKQELDAPPVPSKRRASPAPAPLFLHSDDEVGGEAFQDMDEPVDERPFETPMAHNHGTGETSTLQSSGRPATQARTQKTRGAARKKASVAVIMDDDSDDDAAFKGFRGRKKK
jgi:hypothetical protein